MSLSIMKISKVVTLSVMFLLITITSTNVSATSRADVDHQAITIWSQGIRLAGDIFKPKNMKPKDKLPGILMVPGWGGSRKNIEKNYAPHYAQQGFIVLIFDYKGWGDSDGPLVMNEPLTSSEEASKLTANVTHIRKVINPFAMLEDIRAALHYLGGEPQVMPNNLGIWGTSMGGGLSLVIAANDDRVKALVDQMGPVNYQYNLAKVPAAKMRYVETLAARGAIPPYPGPKSKVNPMLRGYPDWVAMKRFDPMASLNQLTAPTLIIDAEKEMLFETEHNGLLVHNTIKDRIDSKYVTYPGGHYDLYKGDNLVAARQLALEWFVKNLKAERPE